MPKRRYRGHRARGSDPVDRTIFNAVGFHGDHDGRVIDAAELAGGRQRPERTIRRVHRAMAVSVQQAWVGSPSLLELGLAGAVLVNHCHEQDADELTVLAAMRDDEIVDGRTRELHSIRVRRAARRLVAAGRPAATVSVVLATNRPVHFEHALQSIAAQTHPAHDVMIGLHGPEWADDVEQRAFELLGDRAKVERFDGSVIFGEMLQMLSLQASGEMLTKWDDDDWYGPNHIEDLVGALEDSGADLAGKAAEFVRLESMDLTIRRFAHGAERYSTTLAGGTLIIRSATLARAGGWPFVPRHVDRKLIEAVQRVGGVVYRTHGFEYLLRRTGSGHTWDADDGYFLEQATEVRAGLDLVFSGVNA